MEWIKRNPHLLALAVLAVALVASSAFLIMNASGFESKFAAVQTHVTPNNTIPATDLAPINEAQEHFRKPATWNGTSLFIPDRYVVNANTQMPEKVTRGSFYKDTLTGTDIPNQWFLDHGLPLTDPKVPFTDPDGDGFNNEDEWRNLLSAPGVNPTDPMKKESHPPYHTKLFLKQFIAIPFRMLFQTWDGDRTKPESLSFQLNAIDRGRRTEFLKLNENIPNSPYVLKSFEYKTELNKGTGEQEDASQLTVLNTETQDSVVLPITKVTNSPDSYALFTYEWSQPPQPIQVKKLQQFVLKPEVSEDKRYQLLDIHEGKALVKLPDGTTVTITADPRQPK